MVLVMQRQTDGGGEQAAVSLSADAAGNKVELPLHLTEKILCSIGALESARHATVCRAWAATVSARLARPAPHLFLCTPPSAASDRRGLVVSVRLDGGAAPPAAVPSRVRSAETNGLRCIGATPGGRVAFAAGWWSADVVLANPVTGAHQRVRVGETRMDPRHSRVLAAGGAADDDEAFFAIEGYKLFLWRRSEASSCWSRSAVAATLDPTNNVVSAVDCGDGRFYLLHEDGGLSVVDTTAPPPLRMEKLPVEGLPYQFGSGRLLHSDGEVLFVRQLLAYKDATEPCCMSTSPPLLSVAGFEVHRLDVEARRWAKVDRLPADRALFVSPGSSFAVRASDVEGCRSNCIYFAGENRYYSSPACREDGDTSWGVYSMDERRVLFEHVVATEPGRGGAEVLWFLPRVNLGRLCKSLFIS